MLEGHDEMQGINCGGLDKEPLTILTSSSHHYKKNLEGHIRPLTPSIPSSWGRLLGPHPTSKGGETSRRPFEGS